MKPNTIQKVKDGYQFFVYPDIKKEPLGVSKKIYAAFSECQRAYEEFASYVKRNGLDHPDETNIKIETRKNGDINLYYFHYYIGTEEVFCRIKGYWQKAGCIKGIKSVYKNL